jgi:flagellar basal body-associated protein FliL
MLGALKKSKRGYLWVTLSFFIVTLVVHWMFAWFAYVQEQQDHNQAIVVTGYVNQTLRDMMENWQSEFLQLIWQVAGLSFLLYVGSPQSKESSERMEAKLDLLTKSLKEFMENPEKVRASLNEIDRKYYKNGSS